jgi:hypothetical protein
MTGESITWRLRFVRGMMDRITKTTDTHSKCVILIALPRQNVLLNVIRLNFRLEKNSVKDRGTGPLLTFV